MAEERRDHVGTWFCVLPAERICGSVESSRPHVQFLGVVEVAGQGDTTVLRGFYLIQDAVSAKKVKNEKRYSTIPITVMPFANSYNMVQSNGIVPLLFQELQTQLTIQSSQLNKHFIQKQVGKGSLSTVVYLLTQLVG